MAVDMFLKIDGIPGESPDHKHKNTIQIESYSFGMSQSGTFAHGGGGGAGKVAMQDFHFMMRVNKASPKLMQACSNGTHIKDAMLTCRKAGDKPQEYLVVKFYDLLVSNYQTSASSEIPTESVSLNFAKIELEYKEQDAKGNLGGSTHFKYNLKENKAG